VNPSDAGVRIRSSQNYIYLGGWRVAQRGRLHVLIFPNWSLGERFRQVKHDDAKKTTDALAGANEAFSAATPSIPIPIPRLQSPPLTHHALQLQDLDAYIDQPASWGQGHPAGDADSHTSWQPIDFYCPMEQGTRCPSTHSQNGKGVRQSSASSFLSGLDKALAQVSPSYPPLSQSQEQFPKHGSADACHPASLIPSTSSGSASSAVRQDENRKD
jgi:hypothetical protein